MKSLQMKYNLLHFFFWITSCTIFGYVAVFLQYRGLSNSLIGVVTGGGCLGSLFASPMISSIFDKIKGLTIKKLIYILYAIQFACFGAMAILPLPTVVTMVLYIALYVLNISCVPFLSTLAMNYISAGQKLNFGLSRGMGSISYAISAVVLGQLITKTNPSIIFYVFMIFMAIFFVVLASLPDVKTSSKGSKKKEKSSAFSIIKNYPIYFIILLGFGFCVGGSSALGTYLINIVKSLNGSTNLYGIAIFLMAASEMPIMALTPYLLRKFKSEYLLAFAGCCYIARNFLISLAPNLGVLFAGCLFQSVSYGLFLAVITYYVQSHLSKSDQMMGQSMITMMTTGFGSTLGNIVGGILQDSLSLASMLLFARILTGVGTVVVLITVFGSSIKKYLQEI